MQPIMPIVRLLMVTLGLVVLGATGAAAQYAGGGTATVSPTAGVPGSQVDVAGTGFRPNSSVEVTFASTPVTLATVTADGTGAAAARVTIPADATTGAHTLSLVGEAPTGGPLSLSGGFTVSASLPESGSNPTVPVAVAIVALVAGVALVLFVRSRRARPAAG